jgi:hypothetical protein
MPKRQEQARFEQRPVEEARLAAIRTTDEIASWLDSKRLPERGVDFGRNSLTHSTSTVGP